MKTKIAKLNPCLEWQDEFDDYVIRNTGEFRCSIVQIKDNINLSNKQC
ncbi:MAG: hypothetical protein ACOCVX_03025 [Bacteroidales bacterium]